MSRIEVRRIYDVPSQKDGTRFLVDRLWPRGVSKERAAIAAWLKALSPSDALRRRYHGETEGAEEAWIGFLLDYAAELDTGGADMAAELATLDAAIASGPVTLLYAAKNEEHNNAVALRQWLEAR